MTAYQLITDALVMIGALSSGEAPTAAEMQSSVRRLNDMVDSWSNDSILVPALQREEFSLVGGTGTYTIGTGGDFNTPRPLQIRYATVRDSSNVDYFLKVITRQAYNAITTKFTTGIPEFLWYDDQSPLGNVTLYSVPNSAYTLILDSLKTLTSVLSADDPIEDTTTISFPPGYNEALLYNLCIRLASEFGKPTTGEIQVIAEKSLTRIKRNNSEEMLANLQLPTFGRRKFNILSGD